MLSKVTIFRLDYYHNAPRHGTDAHSPITPPIDYCYIIFTTSHHLDCARASINKYIYEVTRREITRIKILMHSLIHRDLET